MKVKDVMHWCEELSPVQYAEDWDNVGLLLGDKEAEVRKIMIALDASDYVIDRAVEEKVDLLLTHHPMIFHSIKQITTDSMIGRRLWKLAGQGISYYAMHTNFDIKGGMAELAADRIGLQTTRPLDVTAVEAEQPEGIGRVGRLSEAMTVEELAMLIKEKFDLKNVMIYVGLERTVYKVAICPGSGKSEIQNAIKEGAEVLVTGDIGHHEGIDAVDMGLTIIDATHYGLEHIFIEYMAGYIRTCMQNADEEIPVVCVDTGVPLKIV